jgi:hypothetical protein
MLYLNTLLKELRNRYVKVPRSFFCTKVDCENDHVTLLRTVPRPQFREAFNKYITKKGIFIANINKPLDAIDTNAGRFTNTRLSRRFWKEAVK